MTTHRRRSKPNSCRAVSRMLLSSSSCYGHINSSCSAPAAHIHTGTRVSGGWVKRAHLRAASCAQVGVHLPDGGHERGLLHQLHRVPGPQRRLLLQRLAEVRVQRCCFVVLTVIGVTMFLALNDASFRNLAQVSLNVSPLIDILKNCACCCWVSKSCRDGRGMRRGGSLLPVWSGLAPESLLQARVAVCCV
jgi:hypothetical protein